MTASQPAIPRERIQLTHNQHRVRGGPAELADAMIDKRDGKGNMCGHTGETTIDHKDPEIKLCYCGKYHQDNSVENLQHICFSCNSGKGGVKRSKKPSSVKNEREREPRAHKETISQRETLSQSEKSERERTLFYDWIGDFFAGLIDTANDKLGIPRGCSIERISIDDLADLAVGEIGIKAQSPSGRYGSSQSYKKFIFEDRFINLYLERLEGVVYVSLRKKEDYENRSGGTLVRSPQQTAKDRNEAYLKSHPSEKLA